jgi:hypothetical protein
MAPERFFIIFFHGPPFSLPAAFVTIAMRAMRNDKKKKKKRTRRPIFPPERDEKRFTHQRRQPARRNGECTLSATPRLFFAYFQPICCPFR